MRCWTTATVSGRGGGRGGGDGRSGGRGNSSGGSRRRRASGSHVDDLTHFSGVVRWGGGRGRYYRGDRDSRR